MLRVYGLDDLDALPAGKWGIREPEPMKDGVPRQDGEANVGTFLLYSLIINPTSHAERRLRLNYYARYAGKYQP